MSEYCGMNDLAFPSEVRGKILDSEEEKVGKMKITIEV